MELINKELYGKTIKSIVTNYNEKYVDEDSLIIEFTDGSRYEVWAGSSDSYTGSAKGEYPSYVGIDKVKE